MPHFEDPWFEFGFYTGMISVLPLLLDVIRVVIDKRRK